MVYENAKVQGGTMSNIIDKDGNPIESEKETMERLVNEEAAHDQLFKDLDAAVSKAAEHLNVPHVLHVGLDFFVQIAYQTAPDKKNAELVIDNTIQRAKNEYSR
jgi:hypothetical protein